jgi:hypothetical protein
MEKACIKCGETKPLDAFYKHPMMSDGHLNKCAECTKSDVRLGRKERSALVSMSIHPRSVSSRTGRLGRMSRIEPVATYRRHGLYLVPADREARKQLAEMKDGERGSFVKRNPRSMAQHRKFFAILNNVVEASGNWVSTEHLRRDILIGLGRFDEEVNRLTGEVRQVPHSMSVASMPKVEFERLYDDMIALLTDALGCDPEMLLQEAA